MKKKLIYKNCLYSVITLFVKKKALRKKEWKNIVSYSFQLSHLMVAMAVVTLETDFWDGEFAIKIEG